MPESTGAASTGLAGVVERSEIARSLEYLQGEVDRLRTPISLGWSLLGLAAWGLWPANGQALVERCLANQSRYGDYDTSALCLCFWVALQERRTRIHTLFCTDSVQSGARHSSFNKEELWQIQQNQSDRRLDASRCCSWPGRLVLRSGSGLLLVPKRYFRMPQQAQAFVAKVAHYQLILRMPFRGEFGSWASLPKN